MKATKAMNMMVITEEAGESDVDDVGDEDNDGDEDEVPWLPAP